MRLSQTATMLISVSLVAGCTTVALAPGADQVQITNNAADVAACTAVGSLRFDNSGMPNSVNELRNRTIGLGGNTVFVTSAGLGEGMAYRCPPR